MFTISLLVKTCNSIAMFFTGVAVTLATVLFILIVIVIYKRRVKDAKESRNVGAIRGTIEMQGHALAGTGPGHSQHNQVCPLYTYCEVSTSELTYF
jgi:hypothetical protein